MFNGSTAGGLQSGPTTGRVDIIPDGGLPQTDVADLVVDLAYLTASLASKADSTNTDAALALKASSAGVDSALALKADAAATTAALAGKADSSTLDAKQDLILDGGLTQREPEYRSRIQGCHELFGKLCDEFFTGGTSFA